MNSDVCTIGEADGVDIRLIEEVGGVDGLFDILDENTGVYSQSYYTHILRTVLKNTRESKRDYSAFSKLLDTPFDV